MARFYDIANKLIGTIDRISHWTGSVVAPFLLVMMILTCAVVIARYLFNVGAIQIQESVMYLHGATLLLGIAYTLKLGGHVRVDIFYQRFGPRYRAVVDIIGTLFFLFPLASFILWTSYDYVSFSWSLKESSAEAGGLGGVYLFKTLIPVTAVFILLQGFSELLKNLCILLYPLDSDGNIAARPEPQTLDVSSPPPTETKTQTGSSNG